MKLDDIAKNNIVLHDILVKALASPAWKKTIEHIGFFGHADDEATDQIAQAIVDFPDSHGYLTNCSIDAAEFAVNLGYQLKPEGAIEDDKEYQRAIGQAIGSIFNRMVATAAGFFIMGLVNGVVYAKLRNEDSSKIEETPEPRETQWKN